MDRIFNADNPVMKFLSRLVDLVVLNVLALLASLPVVTFGASMTALNNVLIHMKRGTLTYVWKMFLNSFRSNLGSGIKIGLCYIAYALIAGADLLVLRGFNTRLATGMMIIVTCISCFVFVLGIYTFALHARFENTIRGTFANAARLAVGHLPVSLGMAAVWIIWIGFLWILKTGAPLLTLLCGLVLPAGLCTMLYDPIFRKMEPPEEE
ncbi:MAG: YesL family protein [Mogibacterium sp.]|nr:YesL family protein [Mogibacterium sp.]